VQESSDNNNETKHSTVKIKLFCFDRKVRPINTAAWNNHTLIPMTVSYNEINLSGVLITT